MPKPGVPHTTPKGYSTWEVISALQKAIRRAQPDLAMFWVIELADAGLHAWAMARLRTIAQEDVGMGDPQAVVFALAAIDQAVEWYKAKKPAWHMAAGNAVMALAFATKSRAADHFQAAIRGRIANGWKPEMPDEALDKHTVRGKRMGRGVEHFVTEGTKLVNHKSDASTIVMMAEQGPNGWAKEAEAFWKKREGAERGEAVEGESGENAEPVLPF